MDSTLEPRRYLTHDMDMNRVELLVHAGGNGDWYVGIVPEGHHTARLAGRLGEPPVLQAVVRVTTSGERSGHIGAANAVADLYRALGGETAEAIMHEPELRTERDYWANEATARLAERDAAREEVVRWKFLAETKASEAEAAAGEIDRAREEAGLWKAWARALQAEDERAALAAWEALRARGIDPDAP